MAHTGTEHDVTLWLVDEQPARMVCAGRRWTVTDTPARLRDSVRSVAPEPAAPRFLRVASPWDRPRRGVTRVRCVRRCGAFPDGGATVRVGERQRDPLRLPRLRQVETRLREDPRRPLCHRTGVAVNDVLIAGISYRHNYVGSKLYA